MILPGSLTSPLPPPLSLSSRLRFIFVNICRTVYRLADLLLFLFVYILLFTFLGYYLFHSEDEKENANYFRTVDESFTSLFVLITTTNYPDVMLPFYRNHRFDFLFFLFYISIGLYLILFMVFASVYNIYQTITVSEMHTYLKNREGLLLQAFDYLDGDGDGAIDLMTWKKLIGSVRPDLNEEQVTILFAMVDEDQAGTINEAEFMEICDYLDLVFEKAPAARYQETYSFVNLVNARKGKSRMRSVGGDEPFYHQKADITISRNPTIATDSDEEARMKFSFSLNHDNSPPAPTPKDPAVQMDERSPFLFQAFPPPRPRVGFQLFCYHLVKNVIFRVVVGVSVGSLIVLTILETYTPCQNAESHVRRSPVDSLRFLSNILTSLF